MKEIEFNKNDFPLTATVMHKFQEAIKLIEKITGIVGNNYILSGCEVIGNSNNPGYVVVNGEVMYFTGGITQTYVIVQEVVSETAQLDATYKETTKQLIFGNGTGQILWARFKRFTDLFLGKRIMGWDAGAVINYADGLPSSVVDVNLTSLLPVNACFAVVEFQHRWYYYTTDSQFSIITPGFNDREQVVRVQNHITNYNTETYIIPLVNRHFEIHGPSQYYGAMHIIMTIKGYL